MSIFFSISFFEPKKKSPQKNPRRRSGTWSPTAPPPVVPCWSSAPPQGWPSWAWSKVSPSVGTWRPLALQPWWDTSSAWPAWWDNRLRAWPLGEWIEGLMWIKGGGEFLSGTILFFFLDFKNFEKGCSGFPFQMFFVSRLGAVGRAFQLCHRSVPAQALGSWVSRDRRSMIWFPPLLVTAQGKICLVLDVKRGIVWCQLIICVFEFFSDQWFFDMIAITI